VIKDYHKVGAQVLEALGVAGAFSSWAVATASFFLGAVTRAWGRTVTGVSFIRAAMLAQFVSDGTSLFGAALGASLSLGASLEVVGATGEVGAASGLPLDLLVASWLGFDAGLGLAPLLVTAGLGAAAAASASGAETIGVVAGVGTGVAAAAAAAAVGASFFSSAGGVAGAGADSFGTAGSAQRWGKDTQAQWPFASFRELRLAKGVNVRSVALAGSGAAVGCFWAGSMALAGSGLGSAGAASLGLPAASFSLAAGEAPSTAWLHPARCARLNWSSRGGETRFCLKIQLTFGSGGWGLIRQKAYDVVPHVVALWLLGGQDKGLDEFARAAVVGYCAFHQEQHPALQSLLRVQGRQHHLAVPQLQRVDRVVDVLARERMEHSCMRWIDSMRFLQDFGDSLYLRAGDRLFDTHLHSMAIDGVILVEFEQALGVIMHHRVVIPDEMLPHSRRRMTRFRHGWIVCWAKEEEEVEEEEWIDQEGEGKPANEGERLLQKASRDRWGGKTTKIFPHVQPQVKWKFFHRSSQEFYLLCENPPKICSLSEVPPSCLQTGVPPTTKWGLTFIGMWVVVCASPYVAIPPTHLATLVIFVFTGEGNSTSPMEFDLLKNCIIQNNASKQRE